MHPYSSQRTTEFSTPTIAPSFIMENILKVLVPVISNYGTAVDRVVCISCNTILQNVYKLTLIINKLVASLVKCLSPTSVIGKMFYTAKFKSGSLITISTLAGDKVLKENTSTQEAEAQSEQLALEAVSEQLAEMTNAEVDDGGLFSSTEDSINEASATVSKVSVKKLQSVICATG